MSKNSPGQSRQQGQIVVEYLLLLIVAVAIVAFAIRGLVQRQEGQDGGVIIQVWDEMLRAIGSDPADDIKRGP
ncbi:MAG TPA: hypothetical protein VFV50_11780 [Bdellovibrionales bacterium]|nr:hypothetical protein [Bdellovibrionales bacterium]